MADTKNTDVMLNEDDEPMTYEEFSRECDELYPQPKNPVQRILWPSVLLAWCIFAMLHG